MQRENGIAKVALFSIKPEYVFRIFDKEKKYEYRKRKCHSDIKGFLIYATAPVKEIVGYAEVLGILEMSPEDLWESTKYASGLSKNVFEEYFGNSKRAIAYQLGEVKRFKEPIPLSLLGLKRPPQSYCYITLEKIAALPGLYSCM